MSIGQELLNAKIEYLQEAWDELLIATWKSSPSSSTGFMFHRFLESHKLTYELVTEYKLLRMPIDRRTSKKTISVFIAEHLPKVNTVLWDNKHTAEQVVAWMARTKQSVSLRNYATLKRCLDASDKAVARRKVGTALGQQKLFLEAASKSLGGSDWKTVK